MGNEDKQSSTGIASNEFLDKSSVFSPAILNILMLRLQILDAKNDNITWIGCSVINLTVQDTPSFGGFLLSAMS